MTGEAFNRLGPRARAALRRGIENAVREGGATRSAPPASRIQAHYDYTVNLVETAMILDAAEASSCDERAFGMAPEGQG
jgi:hypothetical protein